MQSQLQPMTGAEQACKTSLHHILASLIVLLGRRSVVAWALTVFPFTVTLVATR